MKTSSDPGWQQCPDGEFRRFAQRLTANRQRRKAFNVVLGFGAFLAASAAVAAVSYQIATGPTPSSRGSCSPPPSCSTPGR